MSGLVIVILAINSIVLMFGHLFSDTIETWMEIAEDFSDKAYKIFEKSAAFLSKQNFILKSSKASKKRWYTEIIFGLIILFVSFLPAIPYALISVLIYYLPSIIIITLLYL